ncbi:MAG: DUF1345 domain-containing protein [Bifidobacteriaceae bacterium]|nr:DUF1345 domain-containing protein [Bifidobacteriaceae bacterium]
MALLSVGLVIGLGLSWAGLWRYALVGAWAGVSVTYLAQVWHRIGRLNGRQTAARASADDARGGALDIVLFAVAVVSLADVVYLLVAAHTLGTAAPGWHALVALVSIVLSWAVINTLFTVRYARLYQRRQGGIDFNSPRMPSYRDFAYLAVSVGMSYRVPDTTITDSTIRAEVLRHAFAAYLFGTAVLAATLNLVLGLAH